MELVTLSPVQKRRSQRRNSRSKARIPEGVVEVEVPKENTIWRHSRVKKMPFNCPATRVGTGLVVYIDNVQMKRGTDNAKTQQIWVSREGLDRVDVPREKFGNIEKNSWSERGIGDSRKELDKR